MISNSPGEKWKSVAFDFKFTNDYQLQVSDHGRLRAYNKFSDGDILNGSTINGYRIIRLKLYRPKDKKTKDLLAAQRLAGSYIAGKNKCQKACSFIEKENGAGCKKTKDGNCGRYCCH